MTEVHIRKAEPKDHAALVEFNRSIARETEQLELEPEVISAGVQEVLHNPANGFYIVAEDQQQVVAGLMITMEWSDWRNGMFWWVQSVYVLPSHRRQGIYRRLYEYVQELASRESSVCGFRLYVEKDNKRAQETYRALGMREKDYRMFEALSDTPDL